MAFNILKIIIIILIIKIFIINYNQFIPFNNSEGRQGISIYANNKLENEAMETLKKSIIKVREENKYKNYKFFQLYYFFQIYYFNHFKNYITYTDANYWLYLEDSLNENFVKIDSAQIYQFNPRNNDDYIYIICTKDIIGNKYGFNCLKDFLQEHQNYTFIENIFSSDQEKIFLTKKK
jgi:hypothetical protein